MECPNIGEIKFSQISLDAIEDIRRRQRLSKFLVVTIGVGQVANIFFGNGMLESTYSLYSTDFELMAESMRSAPEIIRKSIEQTAGMTYLSVPTHKERLFWMAVVSGCRIH